MSNCYLDSCNAKFIMFVLAIDGNNFCSSAQRVRMFQDVDA